MRWILLTSVVLAAALLILLETQDGSHVTSNSQPRRLLPLRNTIRIEPQLKIPDIRFALVTYSCRERDLDWLTFLPSIPPILRPGCALLEAHNVSSTNGCTESHGYLDAIIQNYDNLESIADVLIFTHAHRTSWHYPDRVDTQVQRLMSDMEYVRRNDAGAVFCRLNTVLATSDHGPSAKLDQRALWDSIYNGTDVEFPLGPLRYGCCGTFWVKTKAIRRRPVETYRQVLKNTLAQSDYMNSAQICGRVGESSWAILFAGTQYVEKPSYCA